MAVRAVTAASRPCTGVEIAVSLVVKLACRFHDDKRDFIRGQRFFQSLEAGRIIADGELLANRMDKDVEPSFTDVVSGVDLRCSASFWRTLALHAGLAPLHLFRTGAEGGRIKLIRGAKPRGIRSRPPGVQGVATPRTPAQIFANSRHRQHARGHIFCQPLSDCAARWECLGVREAGDCYPVASCWFSFVLAMEVAMSRRQTEGAARNSPTDPRHEPGQPAVGRSPDPWRTPQARHRCWSNPRSSSTWQGTGDPPLEAARRYRSHLRSNL